MERRRVAHRPLVLIVFALRLCLAQTAEPEPAALVSQGRFAEAVAICQERLQSGPRSDLQRASLERDLGEVYRVWDHLLEAEVHLRRAAEGADKPNEQRFLAETLHSLGIVIGHLGQVEESDATLRRALAILEREKAEGHQQARVLRSLARTPLRSHDLASASGYLLRALALLETSPDPSELAGTLADLAELRYYQGKDDESEKFLRRIDLDGMKDAGRLPAVVSNQLGLLAQRRGAIQEAEAAFRESIALYENHPRYRHSTWIATPLANLGELLRAGKRVTEAAAVFQKALAALERPGGPPTFASAQVLSLLGRALVDRKRIPEARQAFEKALEVTAQTTREDHFLAGVLETNLGDLDVADGNLDGAERRYARAIQILSRAGEPVSPHLVASLAGRAIVLRRLKRKSEAEVADERARAASALLPGRHTVSALGLRGRQPARVFKFHSEGKGQ